MPCARPRTTVTLGALLTGFALLVYVGGANRFDRWAERGVPGRHAGGLTGWTQMLGNALTVVANPRLVAPVTLAIAVLAARRGRPGALRTVVPALLTATVLVLALKIVVARPGPLGGPLPHPLGWWPSGHTTMAVTCSGALAALSRRRGATLAAAGWSVLIACTMVWVRAHWVTDVLGGLLLGALVLTAALPPRGSAGARRGARSATSAEPG